VGYWLEEDKRNKLRWDEFLQFAKDRQDVRFIAVEPEKLQEMGPYDIFLLRVTNQLGNGDGEGARIVRMFEEYFAKNPSLRVVDPIENQKKVVKRDLMVQTMEELNRNPDLNLKCPRSVILDISHPDYLNNIPKNFQFPIICKSLQASGSKEAHMMGILFSENDLNLLISQFGQSNWILQEYLNHNATIFKVYALRSLSHVMARVSLPNFGKNETSPVFFDSQEWKDKLPDHLTMPISGKALPPPLEDIQKVSTAIGENLGLSLFGYDIIVCVETGKYAVIDINYLPDYRGIHEFHSLLLELLLCGK